ncbi:phage major capsid protein [Primorskyibacter sp. S87]|uniref:phage major capsid protein n=1 Tax=Primorskyibacter sp. S87 TaxID=3415126 RepID=UPI003C7D3518
MTDNSPLERLTALAERTAPLQRRKQAPQVVEVENRSTDALKAATRRIKALEAKNARLQVQADKKTAAKTKQKFHGDDLFGRAAQAVFLSQVQRRNLDAVLSDLYPRSDEVAFRTQLGHLLKSHSSGHTTSAPDGGAALVAPVKANIFRNLTDTSIFGQLAAATDLSFDGAQVGDEIVFPFRQEGTLPGSFVSEMSSIPIRDGQFSDVALRAHKMAVISVFSEELARSAIEPMRAVLSRSITQDTAIALDAVLLSSDDAVPALQPRGLLHGLTPLTPATGGTKVEDTAAALQALAAALIGARATSIAIIMSTTTRSALMLQSNSNGDFVWKDDLMNGEIAGMRVLHATTVPDDQLIAVDPSSLGFAFDDPQFRLSDQATLVMANDADTTPPFMSHSKPGEPATPDQVPGVDNDGSIEVGDALDGSAKVKSMTQHASLALRAIMPAGWQQVHPGHVAYVEGFTP